MAVPPAHQPADIPLALRAHLRRPGDLIRDRHPAAGQGQHQHVGAAGVGDEPLGQPLPRLGAISECCRHDSPPSSPGRRSGKDLVGGVLEEVMERPVGPHP
ncbi:MAG TPA: hypothetical protein VKP69_09075, partial [Isosphaeraceae bacterium]|nr:hypothetical protein [Isosphaeraceae bacterium]